MKNQLFGKATALVMGSLLFFSSQALAISSNNNQELSSADTSRESELIVAQATERLSPQERIALSESIAQVASSLGNVAAVTQAAAIPNSAKIAITRSLSSASAIIGNLLAQSSSDSLTRSDAAAIANSLSEVQSLIDNATSSAQPFSSRPGALDLLNSLATASAHARRGIRR